MSVYVIARCNRAVRRASSRVIPSVTETWFSFFDRRYAAANPVTAPFFFESETAGLMFFRHRLPQGFRW
jgi:hypothetical protein